MYTRNRWVLRTAVIGGPLAMVAVERGWVATEVGRQPWTVWQVLRTADAASTSSGLWWSFAGALMVYIGMTAGRRLYFRLASGSEARPVLTASMATAAQKLTAASTRPAIPAMVSHVRPPAISAMPVTTKRRHRSGDESRHGDPGPRTGQQPIAVPTVVSPKPKPKPAGTTCAHTVTARTPTATGSAPSFGSHPI
jgi:hypothetical protein